MQNTSYRPTWAEIDLGALRNNLACVRGLVNRKLAVMAVVKANAYGHGIREIGASLAEEAIDYLGVATVDEALVLRRTGIAAPILVLGAVLEEEALAAVENDVTLTLCNDHLLALLSDMAKKHARRVKVHIKVDTGMGRIGIWHEEAFDFVKSVSSMESIGIEGIYTHLSSAGRDKMVTSMQLGAFEDLVARIETAGIGIKYKHAANSIAIVDWSESHLNLVRTGILLYGVYPKEDFRGKFKLEGVMTLKTRITHLKDTPPGRSISYGRTYITQQHTRIATIPIGYADGYGRILSNRAEALVRGKFAKVVGMVTMDQTLLDVGHIIDVKIGDEVVLIGKQGLSQIHIEKIAKLAKTIPYEILANVTDRVPRIYR